jgi:glycosyltransferase involved in cell wall biosynthesis
VEKSYQYQVGVYLHYLVWQHLAYKKAKSLMPTEKFDLIHHVTYGSIHMGSELWKLNLPFVYGPMGGGQLAPANFKKYFYRWWRSEVIRKWIGKILLMLPNTRGAIKNAAIILTNNEETYELVQRYKPKSVIYFTDSTLPDSFFPESLPDKDYNNCELRIFWIGRIFARKGLVVVLEALSKVKIPFKLTIVGHGPLSDYIPDWIKQFGLEGKIDYKGKLPWEKVKESYMENDVFMFTNEKLILWVWVSKPATGNFSTRFSLLLHRNS